MSLEALKAADPELADLLDGERRRQDESVDLIASENYSPRSVNQAVGSVLTNKYAEGYPAKRCYGGCDIIDEVERLAVERGKRLFGCEHINDQPHSGSQANMAVYFACLEPGATIMAMDLRHGGHLTHGMAANFSGRLYRLSTTASTPTPNASITTPWPDRPATRSPTSSSPGPAPIPEPSTSTTSPRSPPTPAPSSSWTWPTSPASSSPASIPTPSPWPTS